MSRRQTKRDPYGMPRYLSPEGERIVRTRAEPVFGRIVEAMLAANPDADEAACVNYLEALNGPARIEQLFVEPGSLLVPDSVEGPDGTTLCVTVTDRHDWLERSIGEGAYRRAMIDVIGRGRGLEGYYEARATIMRETGASTGAVDGPVLATWLRGYVRMRRRVRRRTCWGRLLRKAGSLADRVAALLGYPK